MKSILKDIVAHTYALGSIDMIKIVGTENDTLINGISEDRSMVLEAKFNTVHPDFIGTFGMPNLGKLKTILSIDEYNEGEKITINKQADSDGNILPSGLHFENAAGDFKNDYRYMGEGVINDKIKAVKFRGARWNVEFEPTVQNIQRMRFQAAANSEEAMFKAKIENGDLKFFFGDPNSNTGSFVFQAGVAGNFTKSQFKWPVNTVLAILALTGDKTFRMSDEGATMITIDSGLVTYNYIIPAQT